MFVKFWLVFQNPVTNTHAHTQQSLQLILKAYEYTTITFYILSPSVLTPLSGDSKSRLFDLTQRHPL